MADINTEPMTDFFDQCAERYKTDNDNLDELSNSTPSDVVSSEHDRSILDTIITEVATSPLAQMGEAFLAEQTAKITHQLLNNATEIVGKEIDKITTLANETVNLAFNAITAAMTAKNDLIMYFLQKLGEEILDKLDEKDEVIREMQEATRQLHNALLQLVAGDPFFEKYLAQLREALTKMFTAQTELTRLRNTYVSTDIFQTRRYDTALNLMEEAEKLLSPQGPQTDKPFTDRGLFKNIGVPSEPQQLTLMMSIPKLVKQVILSTRGYFLKVVEVNALLLAFETGLDSLSLVKSERMKNWTVGTLDSVIEELDSLTMKMALDLNGNSAAYVQPVSGFRPDPIAISSDSAFWLFRLRTQIQHLKLMPKDALEAVNMDNASVLSYRKAVDDIAAMTDRTKGDAIIRVDQGHEEFGLLEIQVGKFCLAALGAIGSGSIADNIIPLGKAVIARLELGLELSDDIRRAIQPFLDAELPFFNQLAKTGEGVFSMLHTLHLDRAASFFKAGKYTEFFNLNPRTVTYAGAAIAAISTLKTCMATTEDVEKLSEAEREMESALTTQELLMERSTKSGIQLQKDSNVKKREKCERHKQNINDSADKSLCSPQNAFNTDNLVEKFGAVMGMNLLADGFGDDSLIEKAKGFF